MNRIQIIRYLFFFCLFFLIITKGAFAIPALRTLAEARGIEIRTAVNEGALLNDSVYAAALGPQFNSATPELSLIFKNVQPTRGNYVFTFSDEMVDYAEDNGMKVHGHSLVWHTALTLPYWLVFGNWTRDELIEILEDHIKTVVGRYKGRVHSWDVVNEAVNGSGELVNTFWLQGIGPEYIDLAFQWAHAADPDALLFYKDFSVAGTKADGIYELVSGLIQRGVPIHGVDIQMHLALDITDPKYMFDAAADNMKRLSDLGLQVNMVEFEVPIRLPVTEDELLAQADIYSEALQLCLCSPNSEVFEMWGFTDRYSWISEYFPGWGAALPSDENYIPKPAFYAMVDVLEEFYDTDDDGIRDDNGACTRITNPCSADKIVGCYDNCPESSNPGQEDGSCVQGNWQADVPDGIGNVCQDSDGDGWMDADELANETDPCIPAVKPVPDIKANGLDDQVLLSQSDSLVVTISLDPADYAGELADWWIYAFYHLQLFNLWIPIPLERYTAVLDDLPPEPILETTSLPKGTFMLVFGIDLNADGSVDMDQIVMDTVYVIVR
jgi:endo-1,4-beta-xylanase